MDLYHKNDAELVEAYIHGEVIALSLLLDRHLNQTYNIAYRFLKNESEAGDATQESFIKVWKNIKKYDKNKSFKTWLFAILRNTCLDILRKRKDTSFSELDNDDYLFEETITSEELLPDALFEKKESHLKLLEAIDKLPEKEQEIIHLHDTDGLTFEEIAFVTKKPMNTVKSTYRRALMKLRTELS